MALSDMTDAQLLAQINEWFDETQISEYQDAPEFALSQVKLIIAEDLALIQQVNRDFRAYLREAIAQSIAQRMSANELKQKIISDVKTGKIELKALKVVDKNGNVRVDSIQTRAQRMARTELFRTYENNKRAGAQEFMDEPIGIWRSLHDQSVRPRHADLDGQAKALDDWAVAPGDEVNCRCTMIIEERRRFDGEIKTGLIFGKY